MSLPFRSRAGFFGMLDVTFFGLFLTPVFYVALHTVAPGRKRKEAVAAEVVPAAE